MHIEEGTIHTWLDGELSADDATQLETHVAGCAACAALVAEARGLVAASSRILGALDHVPAGVAPKRPTVLAGANRRIPLRRAWWARPQFVAAAAVVMMAVGTWTVTRRATPNVPQQVSADEAGPAAELLDSAALPVLAPPSAPPVAERGAPGATAAVAGIREPNDVVAAMRADAAQDRTTVAASQPQVTTPAPVPPAEAQRQTARNELAKGETVTDSARQRAVSADALVAAEQQRLAGEMRVQAASPPLQAGARSPQSGNAAGAGASQRGTSATLTREAKTATGLPASRCFDLQRSPAATAAGVPAFAQFMEMPGPTIPGRNLRTIVSSAGAGWFWYRSMDGGLVITRVSGDSVHYEARITGLGASEVVGTERPCVSR